MARRNTVPVLPETPVDPPEREEDEVWEDVEDEDDAYAPEKFGGYPSYPSPPAEASGGLGYNPGYSPAATYRPPRAVANVPARAVQFRVQWIDNGRPQEIGDIDVDCTDYDIIAKFGKPGKYWLTPIDMKGYPLTQEPYAKDFSADHPGFRMGASAQGAAPVGGGMGIPPQVWDMLQVQMAELRASTQQAQADATEARRAADERMREATEMQAALAVDNTTAALATQEKLIDAHQSRQADGMNQMLAMMQHQATMQHTASEAMVARIEANAAIETARQEARLEQEQRRHEQWMERMKAESEERRAKDTAEAERKEREREASRKIDADEAARRENARQEDLNRRMTHEQDYSKSMMALFRERTDANDPMNGLSRLIEQFGPILAMAKDAGLDKLIGGNGPQSWADMIGQTVQAGVQGLIEIKKIEAQGTMMGDDDEEDPMVRIQLPPTPEFPQGRVVQMPESQLLAMQAQAQANGQQPPDVQAPGPVEIAEAAPLNQNPNDPRVQAAEQLPPDVRKAARAGLRQLVSALDSEPDSKKWEPMIFAAIQKTPAIYHYLQARAIRPSLLEAGATEGLASKIMQAIETSGKVPTEVPRV